MQTSILFFLTWPISNLSVNWSHSWNDPHAQKNKHHRLHTVMQTCRPKKSAFWQSMCRRNQREWGERKSCACSFPSSFAFYIDRVTKELQVCKIFVLVTPSKIVMNVNVEWCCTAKHQSCIWFRSKTRSDSMRLCCSHCHEYKSDQKQIDHTRVITVWDFHSVIIVSEKITVSQYHGIRY